MPRALFDVTSEERYAYGGARAYKLQAVIPQQGTPDADDPEVNAFWTATPQGSISITITNPDAPGGRERRGSPFRPGRPVSRSRPGGRGANRR
jgi:hypothetical protein